MEGTKSHNLSSITKQIWEYCLKGDHIDRRATTGLTQSYWGLGEQECLEPIELNNWKINAKAIKQIHSIRGQISMDLFAERMKAKVVRFISYKKVYLSDKDRCISDKMGWRMLMPSPILSDPIMLCKIAEGKGKHLRITPALQSQYFVSIRSRDISSEPDSIVHTKKCYNVEGRVPPTNSEQTLKLVANFRKSKELHGLSVESSQ